MNLLHKKKPFPTVAVVLLVASVLWLLSDLKVINIDIPWVPVIVVLAVLGWIVNYYGK